MIGGPILLIISCNETEHDDALFCFIGINPALRVNTSTITNK